jgi:dephospho-CoA kinase
MLKVGITGGIGSGKTTVCKIFELLGTPVYYADLEAKQLQNDNEELKTAILQEFGESIVNAEGLIDRTKLAAIVFSDKSKLQELNSIIHPAVATHFDNWLTIHQSSKYILKEAAILFESGANAGVDKVISVIAPIDIRISRTTKRDNISEELIQQRINNQLSDEEKIKRSDFIIYNNEQQLLIPQIISIRELLGQL